MFNMGGPIKAGVMHGIREPKRDGGKMLLVGQHPKEFQDKSGREKHLAPLLGIGAGIARALPLAWRGFKAARTFAPGNLGKWGRFKDIFSPSGRFRSTTKLKGGDPSPGYIRGDFTDWAGTRSVAGKPLGFWKSMRDPTRVGAAIRENPITAFSLASAVPQVGYAGYKGAKAAPGTIWEGTKRYADMVIPGDQSRWWKDKEPPTDIMKPGGYPKAIKKEIKEAKKLSDAEKNAFALSQREGRVKKYLDLMGYDRSKKMAIADALIDASKIVGDRGTLDPKNITQELINPVIQATSKRLDKPAQIREAVGLMATKAEIEKDLSAETDALAKQKTIKQIEALDRQLEEGFEVDMRNLFTQSRTAPDRKTVERYARYSADKYDLDFTKITTEQLKNAAGETEEEKIINVVGDDGVYLVGDAIIKVTGGVPKLFG
jgi:hypothetical protein